MGLEGNVGEPCSRGKADQWSSTELLSAAMNACVQAANELGCAIEQAQEAEGRAAAAAALATAHQEVATMQAGAAEQVPTTSCDRTVCLVNLRNRAVAVRVWRMSPCGSKVQRTSPPKWAFLCH